MNTPNLGRMKVLDAHVDIFGFVDGFLDDGFAENMYSEPVVAENVIWVEKRQRSLRFDRINLAR